MIHHTRRPALALLAATALAVVLAACSSTTTTSNTSSPPASQGTSAPAGVTVTNPWARTSPAVATAGAVYMELQSSSQDALVRASVPASVAGKVELHETLMGDTMGSMPGSTMGTAPGSTQATMHGGNATSGSSGSMGSSPSGTMASGAAMSMKPVDKIALPAGTTVRLEPGGYHIMLLDLVSPLKAGSSIEVTLTFERAPAQTISVPVRDM